MDTVDYEGLLEAIHQKMESLGINQKEVAKQCGLAPGMFKRIKEGKNLYLETYLKIVNWLKVEFKEFLI